MLTTKELIEQNQRNYDARFKKDGTPKINKQQMIAAINRLNRRLEKLEGGAKAP